MIPKFVRNPVTVTVGVLLVALFGIIGLFSMPLQLTPEVQTPTITIETRWPGASPQEVEQQIVIEQEEQLKSVEGVTKMSSQSMDSSGTITLEFATGTNMSEALLKVQTRLAQVPSYPEDAKEPVISTTNSGDRPIGWFILRAKVASQAEVEAFQQSHPELASVLESAKSAANSGLRLSRLREVAATHPQVKELLPPPDLDVTKFRKFAEDFIEARFERVDGVANANVLGGREEEMQVIVDPQALAARGITIGDVRNALQIQNKDTSGGDFWEGKRRYVLRTLGQYRQPEQVADTIIPTRGGVELADGRPVYVRDVAQVQLGYKKPDGIVKQFGDSSIAINALRSVGANVLDVMDGLKLATDQLNNGILKQRGLQLEQVYDETEYIISSVDLVQENIVVGGLLTIAVLLIFLRSGRATLVIAIAIPVSIIGTFLVMALMGRSLNVISLAGLAFAVGMLVDNAVVVLENIYQHYESGKSRYRAVVDGTTEVWGAVLSSTLTTVAVFLPVLFVKEEAGQLFRDIALAISAGVLLSMVAALTVVPMLAARLLPKDRKSNAKHTNGANGHVVPESSVLRIILKPLELFGKAFVGIIMGINNLLQRWFLLRVGAVFGFIGVSIVLSYLMMPRVEYLPNGNQNLVFGILLPPPGYNLDQLVELGERIESDLKPYWDIQDESPEALTQMKYPPIKDFFFVARGRQVFMGIKTSDPLRAGDLVPLIGEVSRGVPGTFGIAKQASLFEQGLTAGRTIDVEITGPELSKLIQFGGRIFGQVREVVPGCQAIPQPSLDLSSPEVHLTIRPEVAADLGMNAVDVGYSVDALVDGAYAGDYYKGSTKIDLSIIGARQFASRTQDLGQLPIATRGGELVPLGAIANVKISSGPEQINHRQRLRTITIQVAPPPNIPLEDAMENIQAKILQPILDSGELGQEYQITLAGTADKLRSTWTALSLNFILALVITYLLMAALFESWLYPVVVIVSVPLGAFGGFLGLFLLNLYVLQPLDVLTMLGFVILIGTVVNNPILIVEQALIEIRQGKPTNEAVLTATRSRIRPIFMTTLTTVLGLIPLVVKPGAGSELYRGLGAVFLGGLLVSTVVSLIIVPSVFTMTMNAKAFVRRIFGLSAEESNIDEDLLGDDTSHVVPVESNGAHANGNGNGNGNGHGKSNGQHQPSGESVSLN
ncbi:efflux RND transporter permease subunit [Tuwongella immobilis]|uniref:SSD domain-containing protein n=1 Tax=Tuwongella immobilis TaxID=692036 RepID=A0A6C2YP40_9BACT|nr:efflux RND transporter permease subunit [Tuwongella immobilis]VIP03164.1 acriflavin resistance protein : Acriflavin resistance protein D OS=Planctomyces maris DSM 8797 GN=PM8797T_25576 PE=4 SV=1: ACR_tran: ACR_tran: ACR_tran [Tuwongella immobilis]VTS03579.1 acriflavin resistance protein : Acriflavin resistance protein D OS=Planctomyces maris DSM 8797 GN=PM8797T_25576 PE=4 SV=1: ACR_tran: ACR_tran: ACR_tran [Tuwongella immobilis]